MQCLTTLRCQKQDQQFYCLSITAIWERTKLPGLLSLNVFTQCTATCVTYMLCTSFTSITLLSQCTPLESFQGRSKRHKAKPITLHEMPKSICLGHRNCTYQMSKSNDWPISSLLLVYTVPTTGRKYWLIDQHL